MTITQLNTYRLFKFKNNFILIIMENIDLNLNIQYTNDDEYQASLKKVYKISIDDNIDDNIDIFDIMVKKIEFLKEKLININEIENLCNLTAKMMISDNLEIGLLLLHSYDYFDLFYELYCDYFKNEKINQLLYEKLLEKIK